MSLLAILSAVLLLAVSFSTHSARAAIDWPQLTATQLASGLSSPTHLTSARDGTNRIFVVEKPGRVRIIANGALLSTPFLDIRGRVLSSGSEQGLFSVAFPPGYASKGYFYVDYTAPGGGAAGHTVVSRFRLTSANVADAASEEVLLTIDQPYANHNGGQIAFGQDGYLYIGMGDGGSGGDPQNHAQTLVDSQGRPDLLGKLLRMDVESGSTTPQIWALGLRNPWRFSFDRSTGDLYIADVGQNSYEEVDFQPSTSGGGENYGWRLKEGLHCFNPSTSCDPGGLTDPVVEYSHSLGCSISGGFVYRGPTSWRMSGVYFYGDYCSGRVWGLRKSAVWDTAELLDTAYSISSFGEDEAGELYVVDLSGAVYRLADPTGPTLSRQRLPLIPRSWALSA